MFGNINLAILATALNGGELKSGTDMPVISQEAKAYFSGIVRNKPVIMDSDVYLTLKGPIRDSVNIVIAGNGVRPSNGFWEATDVEDALDIALIRAKAMACKEIIVLGGSKLFEQVFQKVDKLYIVDYGVVAKESKILESFNLEEWIQIKNIHAEKQFGVYDARFREFLRKA